MKVPQYYVGIAVNASPGWLLWGSAGYNVEKNMNVQIIVYRLNNR
jgi:hypothetical protein